jgi:hypothetical protein
MPPRSKVTLSVADTKKQAVINSKPVTTPKGVVKVNSPVNRTANTTPSLNPFGFPMGGIPNNPKPSNYVDSLKEFSPNNLISPVTTGLQETLKNLPVNPAPVNTSVTPTVLAPVANNPAVTQPMGMFDSFTKKVSDFFSGKEKDSTNYGLNFSAIGGDGDLNLLSNLGSSITDGLKGANEWMKSSGMLDTTKDGVTTQGWGGMVLGGAKSLSDAYMGMQMYDLYKDTLNHNKEQFNKNFRAQANVTNARLADRQAARVANNPGAYQSVNDYMAKYGVA